MPVYRDLMDMWGALYVVLNIIHATEQLLCENTSISLTILLVCAKCHKWMPSLYVSFFISSLREL